MSHAPKLEGTKEVGCCLECEARRDGVGSRVSLVNKGTCVLYVNARSIDVTLIDYN